MADRNNYDSQQSLIVVCTVLYNMAHQTEYNIAIWFPPFHIFSPAQTEHSLALLARIYHHAWANRACVKQILIGLLCLRLCVSIDSKLCSERNWPLFLVPSGFQLDATVECWVNCAQNQEVVGGRHDNFNDTPGVVLPSSRRTQSKLSSRQPIDSKLN